MTKVNYKDEAQNFLDAVGGFENFTSYLHCVTRLRFNIINKELVEVNKIKESKLCKGINWSGDQLQIILGTGVVEAVYEKVQKLIVLKQKEKNLDDFKIKASKNKEQFRNGSNKFWWLQLSMKTLGDIFLPIIPAIVAAGLAMGFASLIKQVTNYKTDSLIGKVIDIVTKTAFSSLAVLVCWSTVKRFGGNPVLGIIIGLMLINPLLPDKTSIATSNAENDFINSCKSLGYDLAYAKQKWIDAGLSWTDPNNFIKPIKLGFISITGYQGSVLPALVIGIGVAYLEKFIKSWMPKSINIIFTPFLTILIAFLISLFALGPLLLMVENGVLIAVKWMLDIKFGFGTALIAGTLQAIVITGCHQILQGLEMQLVIDGSIPHTVNGVLIAPTGSIFNAIWTSSIISQGGVAMCLALKTNVSSEKNLAISASVSTMFGITEPAIFGSNLPKGKPFLFGLAGGFVGGFFAGLLNVRCPGMGVTVIPGLLLYTNDVRNLLLIILINVISFSIPFLLTLFFYWGDIKKVTEKNMTTINSKIKNLEVLINNNDLKQSIQKLNEKLDALNEKHKKMILQKSDYDQFVLDKIEIKKNNKENKIHKKEIKKENNLNNKNQKDKVNV